MDKIGLWYGQPISKMTKKELLEIITQQGKEQEQTRKQHEEDLKFAFSIKRT